MKDLKKSLGNVAVDLKKMAEQVEKLAGKLEAQTKAKPVRAVKMNSKKTAAQPTAADTVYKIIARLRKGASMAAIRQKTGYDPKKISNLIYKLKRQGKIKSEVKGVYVKV